MPCDVEGDPADFEGPELEDEDDDGMLGIPEGMLLDEELLGRLMGGRPGGGVMGAHPVARSVAK